MTSDPIVNNVLSRIISRSEAGMKKYGVTMERPDVSTVEWLRHAQEEALDFAVYLERIISDCKKTRWDMSYPPKNLQNTLARDVPLE